MGWTAPDGIACAKKDVVEDPSEREPSVPKYIIPISGLQSVVRTGLDLSKTVTGRRREWSSAPRPQAAAQKQAREMVCPTKVGVPLYAEALAPAMAEAYHLMMCACRDYQRER